jgi:hypothetical protein
MVVVFEDGLADILRENPNRFGLQQQNVKNLR